MNDKNLRVSSTSLRAFAAGPLALLITLALFGLAIAAKSLFEKSKRYASRAYSPSPPPEERDGERRPFARPLLLLEASVQAGSKVDAASNIGLKLLTEGLGAPIGLVPVPDGSGRLL